MDRFYQFTAYLKYYRKSKTKFTIHSPFIFEFYTQIMDDRMKYMEYAIPENLKKNLIKDNYILEVEDLGIGNRRESLRTVSVIAKYSSQRRKYGRLLFRIARFYSFDTIIELGTSLGITTSYFAQAKSNIPVYTIEGSKSIQEIAVRNFEMHHLKNIISIQGSFEEYFENILTENNRSTLIFIDGNHAYNPTLQYYQTAKTKIDSNSMIILDDIHGSEEMEHAWNEIIHDNFVRISIDLFQFGILIFRKGLSKEHFILK